MEDEPRGTLEFAVHEMEFHIFASVVGGFLVGVNTAFYDGIIIHVVVYAVGIHDHEEDELPGEDGSFFL